MLKYVKNKDKGFTLIEMAVAIGIFVIFIGFSITSISVIPKTRMKKTAQTVKSEFELARSFAKTHGGDAVLQIKKTEKGIEITRTSDTVKDETTEVKDRELEVFYTWTGDTNSYQLGTTDHAEVENATLEMTFSQTAGAIIGPHYIDSITLSNGSKNYQFYIKQSTGMIYYDYEIEDENIDENTVNNDNLIFVDLPSFIMGGLFYNDITVKYDDGKSVQPEIKYDSRYVKIGGVYRAKEKGTYEIIFSLKDPYSTAWVSGDVEDKILEWSIE